MTESKASGSRSGKPGKALIFVVDDEPMLLELALEILEPSGFAVQTFSDPAQALDAFKSAPIPPALIITDYLMHPINGMALIAACRQMRPRQKFLLIQWYNRGAGVFGRRGQTGSLPRETLPG